MSTRPPPTFRRRVNSQMMRWQARLEAGWADRYLPWIGAAVLTLIYFSLAEARVRSLDAGTDLGLRIAQDLGGSASAGISAMNSGGPALLRSWPELWPVSNSIS